MSSNNDKTLKEKKGMACIRIDRAKLDSKLKERGVSAGELSRMLGKNRGWLSQRAKGKESHVYYVTDPQAQQIVELLSCGLQDILVDEDPSNSPIIFDLRSALHRFADDMPDDLCRDACDLLKFIASPVMQPRDMGALRQVVKMAQKREDHKLRRLDKPSTAQQSNLVNPGWCYQYLVKRSTGLFYLTLAEQMKFYAEFNDESLQRYIKSMAKKYAECPPKDGLSVPTHISEDFSSRKYRDLIEESVETTTKTVFSEFVKLLYDYYILQSESAKKTVQALQDEIKNPD